MRVNGDKLYSDISWSNQRGFNQKWLVLYSNSGVYRNTVRICMRPVTNKYDEDYEPTTTTPWPTTTPEPTTTPGPTTTSVTTEPPTTQTTTTYSSAYEEWTVSTRPWFWG